MKKHELNDPKTNQNKSKHQKRSLNNFLEKCYEPYMKKRKKEPQKQNMHLDSESDHIVQNQETEMTNPKLHSEEEILSKISFSELKGIVCDGTLKAIAELGYIRMTKVQVGTLPHLLERKDLVGAAKTGSGKTLAFLVPAIELMYRMKFSQEKGTGVIILSPTRELSIQTFGILKELIKYHHYTYGLVIGGTSRKKEAKMLSQHVNILVATPGRLLDHLKNTPKFVYDHLNCLVIDEADRILEIGFEDEMKQIIRFLPKKRQTVLFSATQNKKTEALTALAMSTKPVYVDVDDCKPVATVCGLKQSYVECPSEKKLMVLLTLLKKNKNKKVIVFFGSCLSVKFHHRLFNFVEIPVTCIHGKEKQSKRTNTFLHFCKTDTGILFCTDVVARGLDIPKVDLILQYDPPRDPKEYIHRVGRTARGEGSVGNALLFLRSEELDFLNYLKSAKVPVDKFECSWNKIVDIQTLLENAVEKNYDLRMLGKKAYKAYVRTYNSYSLKSAFDINTLDLTKVAKSFGFKVPPVEGLIVSSRRAKQEKLES